MAGNTVALSAAMIDAAGGDPTARAQVGLTRYPIFGALGDSNTEYNDTSVNRTNAYGYLRQAQAYSGYRFKFPYANNFGISGQNTAQIAARVGSVIASGAGYCVVLMGTNDPTTGITDWRDSWVNIKTTYDALIKAGIVVIAMCIPPRSVWSPITGSAITKGRLQYYQINQKIREYARSAPAGMFWVCDSDLSILDRTSANGDPLGGAATPTTQDGIHFANFGADLVGRDLAAVINKIIPPITSSRFSLADIYSATDNPLGNRMGTRGVMAGSSGTAVNGVNGSVATGWSAQRITGSTLTATASLQPRPGLNGGQFQRLVLGGGTGGATTEQIILQCDLLPAADTWAAGDNLEFLADITVSGLVNVANISLTHSDSQGFTSYGLYRHAAASNRILPDWTKTILSPPGVLAQAATFLRMRIVIDADCSGAGVSGTIDVPSAIVRTAT